MHDPNSSAGGAGLGRQMALAEAIERYVAPGMHLHFASTPSRSNSAIRELARRFRGSDPQFTISTSGFHSTAHLLALLRLGRRYIAAFFGDNYPTPRPNPLYTQLEQEGAALEHWSLWSYVQAFKAGALGQPYAVTTSLTGTTLGAELAAAGRFAELADPLEPGRRIGMVAALRSDITFVHGLLADSDGNVAFSAPYGEGFWSALGARRGVIVTVERLVPGATLAALQDTIKIPADRILAICVEPFGAHPQPLYSVGRLPVSGYRDDVEHYQRWRAMTQDAERFQQFQAVLDAADGAAAYRAFVGEERLDALRGERPGGPAQPESTLGRLQREFPSAPAGQESAVASGALSSPGDALIVRAAYTIAERVRQGGYRAILAGIGQAFVAARLAKFWLARQGVHVAVMVETGLYDIDCGPHSNDFLLSYDTSASARRLTAIEDVLGTLTCGADNRCLGVIGAAQIDAWGNINSTRLADGRLLVGSGGANDIASAAAELIVLTPCARSRLVPQVDYITSPGRAVRCIVTDLCTLRRAAADSTEWTVEDIWEAGGVDPGDLAARIQEACGWSLPQLAAPTS